MKITVADFNIEIKNKYKFIENQCADYINDFDKPDFIMEVTEEEINREKQRQSYQECFKDSYIELVLVYRKLCFMLPENDAIMLHSAVFSLENRVIALVANSGVGKTTHMMFYKELFGDKVTVINGDKPIIRYIDNELFVYGTPWCGKEKMNTNTKKIHYVTCGEVKKISEKNKKEVTTTLEELLGSGYATCKKCFK